MEILISSKTLAQNLNKILENTNSIAFVRIEKETLTLISGGDNIQMDVHAREKDRVLVLSHKDARWDWIKVLVNQIDEQPIVLIISCGSVNVRTQY